MADHRDKSLMRSLGELVGGVWWGVKTPADHEKRVSKTVETDERVVDGKRVRLRRTTTEEMIVEPMEPRDAP